MMQECDHVATGNETVKWLIEKDLDYRVAVLQLFGRGTDNFFLEGREKGCQYPPLFDASMQQGPEIQLSQRVNRCNAECTLRFTGLR